MKRLIVLALDVETTGLIESKLMRLDFQPRVIQVCLVLADLDSGDVLDRFVSLIRPPTMEAVTKKITSITGITPESLADAPEFAEVAPRVATMIESAPMAAAHNLSFDRGMIDLEMRRLKREIRWPKRLCCTVEQTVHLLGFNADLTKLHDHLVGRPFIAAHTAEGDVDALLACLVEMRRRDML